MYQPNNQSNRSAQNNHMIDSMSNYMLTNKNMVNYLNKCVKIEKIEKAKNIKFKPSKNIQTLFFPCQEDNLFWIYYIMINTIDKYKMLGEHTYRIEKEEKMKCIEYLKPNKGLLKDIKSKVNECENDLMNNQKISIYTFISLCIIKNLNPCIIFKNIYFIYDLNEEPSFIIHKVNNMYGYEPYNETIYNAYITNKYHISNINKPINAISNYKVDEIKKLCNILGISYIGENQKNKTKLMLYDDVKNLIQLNII